MEVELSDEFEEKLDILFVVGIAIFVIIFWFFIMS